MHCGNSIDEGNEAGCAMRFREIIMDCNLHVVFQNMPEMKSIRKHLEKQVRALDQKFDGIESCRVAVQLPYHHRYPGNVYDFRIGVIIPGTSVEVARSPSANGADANLFALIRDAFDEVEQKLDACACARGEAVVTNQVDRPNRRAVHDRKEAHLTRRAANTDGVGPLPKSKAG